MLQPVLSGRGRNSIPRRHSWPHIEDKENGGSHVNPHGLQSWVLALPVCVCYSHNSIHFRIITANYGQISAVVTTLPGVNYASLTSMCHSRQCCNLLISWSTY